MAAASHAMSARGQLEEAEVFARRGLELAGDRDSEGRRRCCIELAECDLYQGRFAEGYRPLRLARRPRLGGVHLRLGGDVRHLCGEPR